VFFLSFSGERQLTSEARAALRSLLLATAGGQGRAADWCEAPMTSTPRRCLADLRHVPPKLRFIFVCSLISSSMELYYARRRSISVHYLLAIHSLIHHSFLRRTLQQVPEHVS